MGVVLVVTSSKDPRFLIVVVVNDIVRSGFMTRFVVVVVVDGGLRVAPVIDGAFFGACWFRS